MDVPKYKVRTLHKKEIPQAFALWKDVGYIQGNHCIETWFEIDRNGFWVAVTEQEEIIGLCCAVATKANLFHLGLYGVKEQYRRRGIGMAVWQACLDHIGDGNAVLNTASHTLEAYKDKGGFPIEEERWMSYYYQSDTIQPDSLLSELPGIDIVPIDEETIPLALEYDSKVIGYERGKVVRLTVSEQESTSYLAVENGVCVGYGVYKVSCTGLGMVGPLYAESQDIAEVLLKRLIKTLPQVEGFYMMIADGNPGAKSIIDKLRDGMYRTNAHRLYRKENVDIDMNKVFGHFNPSFCPN